MAANALGLGEQRLNENACEGEAHIQLQADREPGLDFEIQLVKDEMVYCKS